MSGSSDEKTAVDMSRAVVFGEDAERYERARPSYPAALVDTLIDLGGHRVLDVGCGTGKAGRLLAEKGMEVLGVDPDQRMATVARRHGLVVEVARFEEWDPARRSFDLVVSGQAWHWVDSRIGAAKAADVLALGGSLALFWNRLGYNPVFRKRLDDVYQRVAPAIARSSAELGTVGNDKTSEDVAAIEDCGRFASVAVRSYPWEWTYTQDGYLDQLRTHSDHVLLPGEQLHMLLERIGDVISEAGGRLTVNYTTTLILAEVKPPDT